MMEEPELPPPSQRCQWVSPYDGRCAERYSHLALHGCAVVHLCAHHAEVHRTIRMEQASKATA